MAVPSCLAQTRSSAHSDSTSEASPSSWCSSRGHIRRKGGSLCWVQQVVLKGFPGDSDLLRLPFNHSGWAWRGAWIGDQTGLLTGWETSCSIQLVELLHSENWGATGGSPQISAPPKIPVTPTPSWPLGSDEATPATAASGGREETRKPGLQTSVCTAAPKAWSETGALFQLPISSVEPEDTFPSPSVGAFVGCLSRNPWWRPHPWWGNPGLRSWEASQRACELLSVALFSCSFIFLISNIDLCYLSKYGAFKKSSLFKKCSGLELRALLSYLAGPASKGERAAAWSQIGKHSIFFNQTRAVFPHTGQVLNPGVAVNLIIFQLGCHIPDFFPQPMTAQHRY